MSRTIKFRLWDKTQKQWITNAELDSISSWSSPLNSVFQYNKNIVFQQFIGLRDKKGKEIYEGDIAIYQPNRITSKTGEILFEDGAFVFNGLKSAKGFVCLHAFTKNEIGGLKAIKVIGNIFQNPELLKKP
jgi:uncharacterized phage protein (TIGR01671 family)